jgi:hypothetical protein
MMQNNAYHLYFPETRSTCHAPYIAITMLLSKSRRRAARFTAFPRLLLTSANLQKSGGRGVGRSSGGASPDSTSYGQLAVGAGALCLFTSYTNNTCLGLYTTLKSTYLRTAGLDQRAPRHYHHLDPHDLPRPCSHSSCHSFHHCPGIHHHPPAHQNHLSRCLLDSQAGCRLHSRPNSAPAQRRVQQALLQPPRSPHTPPPTQTPTRYRTVLLVQELHKFHGSDVALHGRAV